MKKLLFLLLFFPMLTFAEETLRMTVLEPGDVSGGAGLCVIFQTPEGKTFLFDTALGVCEGANPENDDTLPNNGREIILPWLEKHGIQAIDGLVISHAHADHFGGFIWLSKHFPIRKLWDPGYTLPGTDPQDYRGELGLYARLRDEYAKSHPDGYKAVHAGDTLDWGKDLTVEIVWPPKEFTGLLENPDRMKRDTPVHHLINANSIGMRVIYKDVKIFIVGDIQQDYLKERMIPFLSAEKWKCDVCVLPSHGIHTIPEEVALTRPQIAIASLAELSWDRKHGIARRVRQFYEPAGAKVYVTYEVGDVTVSTDGKTVDVKTER